MDMPVSSQALSPADLKLWEMIEQARSDECEAVQRYVEVEQALVGTTLTETAKAEVRRISRQISAMEREHAEWLSRLSILVSGVPASMELEPSYLTVPNGSWPPNTGK